MGLFRRQPTKHELSLALLTPEQRDWIAAHAPDYDVRCDWRPPRKLPKRPRGAELYYWFAMVDPVVGDWLRNREGDEAWSMVEELDSLLTADDATLSEATIEAHRRCLAPPTPAKRRAWAMARILSFAYEYRTKQDHGDLLAHSGIDPDGLLEQNPFAVP